MEPLKKNLETVKRYKLKNFSPSKKQHDYSQKVSWIIFLLQFTLFSITIFKSKKVFFRLLTTMSRLGFKPLTFSEKPDPMQTRVFQISCNKNLFAGSVFNHIIEKYLETYKSYNIAIIDSDFSQLIIIVLLRSLSLSLFPSLLSLPPTFRSSRPFPSPSSHRSFHPSSIPSSFFHTLILFPFLSLIFWHSLSLCPPPFALSSVVFAYLPLLSVKFYSLLLSLNFFVFSVNDFAQLFLISAQTNVPFIFGNCF